MLSDLLKSILAESASAPREGARQLRLLHEVWPTLVGAEVAKRSIPVDYKDHVVVVLVSSQAWCQEMQARQPQIEARIRQLWPWPLRRLAIHHAPELEALEGIDGETPARDGHGVDAGHRPVSDAMDGELEADLDRLDPGTRELALRIRGHMQRRRPSKDNVGAGMPRSGKQG